MPSTPKYQRKNNNNKRIIDSIILVASEVGLQVGPYCEVSEVYMHFKKYPSCYFRKILSGARIKMIASTRQFWQVVYVQLWFFEVIQYPKKNSNNVLLGGFFMSQLCI
jgi:hypothetical protein